MIESNDSSKEVLGTIKLGAGITNMEVLAVNPTLTELNAIGINAKQEPKYSVEINGRLIFKVVFWVRMLGH